MDQGQGLTSLYLMVGVGSGTNETGPFDSKEMVVDRRRYTKFLDLFLLPLSSLISLTLRRIDWGFMSLTEKGIAVSCRGRETGGGGVSTGSSCRNKDTRQQLLTTTLKKEVVAESVVTKK